MEARNENGLKNLNPDAPDFVKDIHLKSSSMPVDLNIQFVPQNPYTLTTDAHSLGQSQEIKGIQDQSGFFETVGAETRKFNFTYQGFEAAQRKLDEKGINNPTAFNKDWNPFLLQEYEVPDIAPPDWNPKADPTKFVNIKPEYLSYLFEANSPKDLDFRLQRVHQEQHDDEVLANGSWLAKLVGAGVGIVTDPMSYIPIAGWAKYAKVGSGFLKNAARALPGSSAYGILSSAAEQADKINGNMQDFLMDSFVRTTFGSVLFGALGAAGSLTDKAALWELRNFAKESLDGIDYKIAVDEAGKITGFKAIDTSGSLSAAKVDFAQDLANSSFSKQGVFKIPYLGEGLSRFLSMPVLGTPLPALLNSPFKTMRAFVDRVHDHSIITQGIKEGEEAPVKFATLMNQEVAKLRALDVQMRALHLERNGFDTKARPLNGIVNLGLNLKDKALKVLAPELQKADYVSKTDFYTEVEEVLRTEVASKHAPVNEAANMMRNQMDTTYAKFREAYNLPKDWMPPKTAAGYLMRVYDTDFLNSHENEWITTISSWLQEADQKIFERSKPILDLQAAIKEHSGTPKELAAMKAKLNALEEQLQNDLRVHPELQLHVEDWNALSADEAKEILKLTQHRDNLEKEIKSLSRSKKDKERMNELKRELEIEEDRLQQLMHEGKVSSRLYTKTPDSFIYHLKNPNERLKFRKTYESDLARREHAKAYYDTIMNQTPEDTINQVMARFTGNARENPLKSRTLLVPDDLLYKNNFMTKDLMSKVSNYTTYLARRTHFKNVFNDVSIDGGVEPLLHQLNLEHEAMRVPLNEKLTELKEKLNAEGLSVKDKNKIEKQINKLKKQLDTTKKKFEKTKKQMNHIYEKIMGISKLSRTAQQVNSIVMSITAAANLPFVPFTMINDLGAIGLQHGILPFIRDGVYPMIQSFGGLLKTAESEAFRKTAPSVHLALQDVLMGYADRNWSMMNNPYLNLGRWVNAIEKVAHASTNFTLTNYLDNGLQHISSSIAQSEFMRIMHAFKNGTMTKKEGEYIRKYGLDPEKWADRMTTAFKKDGGGKTKLGGYQSLFWKWEDLEAANHLGNAVFRAVKDTQIQAGVVDSPLWTDPTSPLGIMGTIMKGFNGWMYASVNRYVIPSLQQADAQKLMGVLFMLGTGALVSPMRRMARGENPYPDNMTDKQWMWEVISDSGYFSFFTNVLSDANIFTNGTLLDDLKNDRYKDRTMVGLLGPAWGTANRMKDVVAMLASREFNEADMKKAARMIPFANASWTYWMSKTLVENLNLPKTRAAAHALKEIGQ